MKEPADWKVSGMFGCKLKLILRRPCELAARLTRVNADLKPRKDNQIAAAQKKQAQICT